MHEETAGLVETALFAIMILASCCCCCSEKVTIKQEYAPDPGARNVCEDFNDRDARMNRQMQINKAIDEAEEDRRKQADDDLVMFMLLHSW